MAFKAFQNVFGVQGLSDKKMFKAHPKNLTMSEFVWEQLEKQNCDLLQAYFVASMLEIQLEITYYTAETR